MGLLESALGYGMARQDDLLGTLVADMHGHGVKSWNLRDSCTRFGTFVIYIVPENLRQAFELRTLMPTLCHPYLDPGTTRTHQHSNTTQQHKKQ